MKKTIALLMASVMALATPVSVLAEEWDTVVISEETAGVDSEGKQTDEIIREEAADTQENCGLNGSESEEIDPSMEIVIESVEEIDAKSDADSDEKENESEVVLVLADGEDCGEDLTWILDSSGVLMISGSGAMADYEPDSLRWDNREDAVIHVILEDGITEIGSFAFYDCTNLTDIVIPESVTAIGTAAFKGCSSLKDVVIPDSVTDLAEDAFEGCTALLTGGSESEASADGPESEIGTAEEQKSKTESEAGTAEEPGSETESETDTAEEPESETGTADEPESETESEAGTADQPERGAKTESDTAEESESETETEPAPVQEDGSDYLLEEEDEESSAAGGYELETGEEDCEEDPEEDPYGIRALSVVSSGSCGTSATWSLSDAGVLTISGSGATEDYTSSSRPGWESSKSSIVSLVVESGITKIGDWTFYNHSALQSVSIASSVTSFGRGVFAGCRSLTSVTLPSGVTEIPYAMFGDCTSLTSFSASGAVSYGEYAFQSVVMDTFTVGKKVTDISYLAFYGASVGAYAVESGNSVYSASGGVLFTNSGKTLVKYPAGSTAASYTVPSKVTKIEAGAFLSCGNLQQVSLGSVTSLGESAFQNCGLTSLTIPNSVTEADYFTFYGCKSLTSIKFGTGLKETSYEMFEECTALTSIDFGSKLETLGARTFAYCNSLTSVSLPSTIKSVENGVFGECKKLQSFSCKGLTSIPYQAFCNTTALTNVSLGEGLTTINRYAFCGCTSLKRVVLPSTITFVHADAFDSWTELVQSGTSLTPFGTNGLRETETVTVSGTRDYTKAYEVLDIVNQRRKEQGLSSLVMNESLLETAMLRAEETSLLFAHTRPTGSSCFTANSLMMAENVAYGDTTASAVMSGWMNSEGHKENILNESYSTIGIGCFVIDGAYYWVQCFGTGSDKSSCAKPSNRSVTESIAIATETFDEASTTSGIIWGVLDSYTYALSVKLEQSSIGVKETTQATVYLKNPGNNVSTKIGGTFTWKSSKTSVATVSSGKVKGVAKGSSAISATTQKKAYTGQATVTVTDADTDAEDSSTASTKLAKVKITSLKNKTKGILIKWGKVSGAKGYYVYRKSGSGSFKKIATLTGKSTLSYKDKSVKNENGTKYSYKVVAYNDDGKGTGKTSKIVRLTGTSLSSVKNKKASKAAVTWKKAKKITGYQIQYSTSKTFAKNNKKVKVSGAKNLKKTISGLKKGKTYYVRIRTYKKSGGSVYYSAWSAKKKVKVTK